MAEIGKLIPATKIITPVPRERPVSDDKEHQQPKQESRDHDDDNDDENSKDDMDGGIDLYV